MEGVQSTNEVGLFYWDNAYNSTMFLSLAIIIALFASIRLFSGAVSHVDSSYELTQKDNGAFGISLAGVVFAVTLVLSGVIPSSWAMDLQESLISVTVYGVLGIMLMILTRVIFDRIALPRVNIREEIVRGNYAAAIIDTGNVIAAAVVIRSVMRWVADNSLDAIGNLLILYVVSQALLTLVVVVHARIFSYNNGGRSMQKEFVEGNTALALRFAGRRIGIAFAITAAANIMTYEIYEVTTLLFAWVVISCIVVIALTLLSWFASRIILFGIKVNEEVLNQRNVAIGAVQGVIYVSLGLVLSSLMS